MNRHKTMKSLQDSMIKFYEKLKDGDYYKMKGKTILITGASGLIGANLLAYLDYLNQKHKLDLKIVGIIRSKLEPWMTPGKNISYIQQDLSKTKLKADKFDYLVHCATYGQPKKFLKNPHETVTLNIEVLFDLLKLAQKNNATFMYMSSSEIYGEVDKKNIPTKEDYYGYVNTLSDRAIYAESKRLAESICYQFSKKTRVKIARLLICYGPGVKQGDQRVYCEFIKKAQTSGEITMMDKGLARRTFCFISDAVEMLLNILLSSKDVVYNVGGQDTVTIRELAKLIAKINNAKVSSSINNKEISGTPTETMLSNKKYLTEFHKTKFIPLIDGMMATSEWLKNL